MADGILSIGADVSPMVRDVRAAYARLQNEINSNGLSISSSKASRSLSSLTVQSERLSKSLSRSAEVFLSIASVSSAIYGTQRAFVALVQSVRETELVFAQIQSILQASSGNFKQFQKDIFQVANQTGTAFSTAADVANEFARQGLNLNDTLVRTKDALTLVRLSGISTAEAVSSLTAIVNTFRNEALNSTDAVERLANVSAAYAVAENDLASALQRTGAAAAESGVEFNQLISVITALQERTARGGAVIGNGLKSIFTRTKSSESLDLLEGLGVAVRNLEGDTLPVLDILTDLAKKFQSLSSSQKSSVTEATAGIYQVNTLQALLADLSSEYSVYAGALDIANNSTNQAATRTAVLNETLDALFIRTQNNLQQFNSGMGSLTIEPLVRNILGGLNTVFAEFEKFEDGGIGKILLKGIGEFISGPALVLLGGALFKIGKSFSVGFSGALKDLAAIGGFANKYAITQAQIEAVLNSQNESHIAIISAAKTEEQQAQAILRVMKMITQETRAQAAYFAATTTNVNRVATGVPIGPRPRGFAGGFLPDSLAKESLMVKKGVGGASPSAKPVVVKGFNTGTGKETIVANTDEYIIKNYNGSGADAVFNKDMLRSVGGLKNLKFLGDVSRVSSGGFTPNLAGGSVPLRGPKGIIKVEKETIGLARNLKEYSEANKLMAKELKSNQKQLATARKKAAIISNKLEQDAFMGLSNLTKKDALKPAAKEKLLAQKENFDAIIKPLARKEKANAKTLERIASESKIVSTELGRRTKEEKKPILAAKKAYEAARAKRSGGSLPLTIKGTPEYDARKEAVMAKRSSRLEEAALLKKFTQEEVDKKRNENLRAKAKVVAGTAPPENTGVLSYDDVRKKAELKLQNEETKKKVEQDLINEGRMQGPKPPKPPDDPEDVLRNKRAKKAQLDAINAKLDAEELEARRVLDNQNKLKAIQDSRAAKRSSPDVYGQSVSQAVALRNQKSQERAARAALIESERRQDLKAQKSAKFGAALQRGQMGAFGASFLLPLAGEALKEGADEGAKQKIEIGTNALSTAAAVFATFPNKIGLIVAATSALGIALKGVVDYNSTIGKSAELLKKEAEEEANSTNEVVNSVRGYITTLNQLNDAINAGASSSSIKELRSKTLESLFNIEDESLRKKAITISERQFTKEETDEGIDQFSEFQKMLEEISDPSRQSVSQTEFKALLRTLDDQRVDGITKISRLFSGKDESLRGVGYDSASSEIISELIRGVGSDNALAKEPVVDKFLQDGGSFEALLENLGLDVASNAVKEWSEKLGGSKELLAENLALQLKGLAIDQERIEAEDKIKDATIVAKQKLQEFSKGVSLSAKILNNNANREFSLKSFRATNNFSSGANSVADSFVEAAVAKAEAINTARSETFGLKESLVSQAGQSNAGAKISQEELQERIKGINDIFSGFKDGDIGLKGLMTVVEDASNEEQIGTAEVIEKVSSVGLDLEDSLTKVREKLYAGLERIRKSNNANLFGGLGAVSKGNPFEAGNKLFEARLGANKFLSEDKPKNKEGVQSFNERGFEISKELISARLNDLMEKISNGLIREDIDSAGTNILSKLEQDIANGGDAKTLGDEAKDQISKLFPEGKVAARDLANLVSTQARSSFQNDFSKFKSGTSGDVSNRDDFKKVTQEIENALKSGVPLESINLDPLGGIIAKSKDKQSVLDFNLLKGSKSEAERNIARANADNDENGISDFGEAVIDKESGKNAFSEAVDAMVALAGQKNVQDQIRQNTEDAATYLDLINGKFGDLQKEFVDSENSVSGRKKALEEITQKNARKELALSSRSQKNLTSRIEAAKAERDEKVYKTTVSGDYAASSELESKASPERIKELEKQIELLEKVRAREIEKSKTLQAKLQGPALPSLASGFLPMDLESSLISKGVGGARRSAKPVLLNGVNTGSGKESIVANTDEYLVRNFRGSKKDAIFNREMVRNIGGVKNLQNMGNVSKVSAGGMLPKYKEYSIGPKSERDENIINSPSLAVRLNMLLKNRLPRDTIHSEFIKPTKTINPSKKAGPAYKEYSIGPISKENEQFSKDAAFVEAFGEELKYVIPRKLEELASIFIDPDGAINSLVGAGVDIKDSILRGSALKDASNFIVDNVIYTLTTPRGLSNLTFDSLSFGVSRASAFSKTNVDETFITQSLAHSVAEAKGSAAEIAVRSDGEAYKPFKIVEDAWSRKKKGDKKRAEHLREVYGLPLLLPAELEKSFIKSGVGGAKPSASPVLLKNGVTANTDELLVENFQESGQDAIFNQDMLKRIGGLQNLKSLGRVSKVAAGGAIPVGGFSNGSTNILKKFSNDNSNENKQIIQILKEISNKGLTDLIKEIKACECGNKTAPAVPAPAVPAPAVPAPAVPAPAVPAPAVPAPAVPAPADPLDQYKTPEDKRKEAYNKIIANANAAKEERERKSRIIQDTADEAAQKRAGGTSNTPLGKAAAEQDRKRNALINDPAKNPVAFDTFSGAGVVKENFGMEGDKVANTLNRINDLDGQLGDISAQKSAREKALSEKSDSNNAPEKIEYSYEQRRELYADRAKLSTKITNLKKNLAASDRTSVIPERQNEINKKIDEWARNMPDTYPEESALYRSEGDRKVLRKPQTKNRIKELEADLKLMKENSSRMHKGQSLIPMPSNSPIKPAIPREVMDSIYQKQNRIENKDGTPAELNRLKEEIEKLKQGSSSDFSQTSLKLDGGKPLEVNVSFNGNQNQEVEKLVNVEFAKFQEKLQRGLDNFARNNKLTPSVVNTA